MRFAYLVDYDIINLMYPRILEKQIEDKLFLGKAIIIYGPRQVGKTTLLKSIFGNIYKNKEVTYLSCDDPVTRRALTNKSATELKSNIGNCDIVILDEAQLVENIGITIKLLVDNYPHLQVIATGSSSFELANKIVEPLTGRAYEFSLYGLSLEEIENKDSRIKVLSDIENIIILGTYPAIITSADRKIENLGLVSGGFLYKDILAYEGIRKPELLEKILTVLARSISGELSIQSIANDVDASQQTVSSYINLLEQAHIVYTLKSLESNDISSMRKKKKYYITDTGIRNSISGEFVSTDSRSDVGQLWENLCVLERIKFHTNAGRIPKLYFWRNENKAEVDLIDLTTGYEKAFEFTYSESASKNKRIPRAFISKFPNIKTEIVYKDVYYKLFE